LVAAGDTRLVVADILRVAACRLLVEGVDGDRRRVARLLRVVVEDGVRLQAALLRVVADMDRLQVAHLRVAVDTVRLQVAHLLRVAVDMAHLQVAHLLRVAAAGVRLKAALQEWVLMRLLLVVMALRLVRWAGAWALLVNASSSMAKAASCSASFCFIEWCRQSQGT
jgi:hypothetical protein